MIGNMTNYQRLEKPYQEGWKAFHDSLPWSANPYEAGSLEWCNWNDGKHDAGDQATEQEMADYYNRIGERELDQLL